jgi:hypothetical protein
MIAQWVTAEQVFTPNRSKKPVRERILMQWVAFREPKGRIPPYSQTSRKPERNRVFDASGERKLQENG